MKMNRKTEMRRRRGSAAPRFVAVLVASVVLGACIGPSIGSGRLVTVVDSGGRGHTTLSFRPRSGAELLRTAGAVASVHDALQLRENPAENATEVLVRRAFPVQLTADGEEHTAQVVEGTVADLLERSGVALEGEDYVRPAKDTPLEAGLEAQVYRVDYEEDAKERQLVSDTTATAFYEDFYRAQMVQDPEFSYRLSNRKLYDVTYRRRLVNGKVESTEITSLESLILPREPGSTAFEPGIPCSRIEGYDDVEMGEDGLPLNYTRVIKGAVTTAYSASRGSGSSGLGLYNGTCAVNPNVIPYGTRMWITDSSQNFVYGFCIATDTGTAMMEGRVDIDLFFETNGECLRFGKRNLDVYILD